MSAGNQAPTAPAPTRAQLGKCQQCPAVVRLTPNGKIVRHKRLRGAREYGDDKVWCEGSGIVIRPPSAKPWTQCIFRDGAHRSGRHSASADGRSR